MAKDSKHKTPEFDAYVLMHVTFEENDGKYFASCDASGSVEKVLMSKEKAKKLCLYMNMKRLTSVNIYDYNDCQNGQDMHAMLEALRVKMKVVKGKFSYPPGYDGEVEEYIKELMIKEITPEQATAFIQESGLHFYSVLETKLDLEKAK